MSFRRRKSLRVFASLSLLAWVAQCSLLAQTSNVVVRVMAANLTSGTQQSYESPGIRIFQGLKPDIVAIQEFQYAGSTASNDLRTLVNTAFGTNYSFYCEPNNGIPNGIVSRYPILNAGFWEDSDTGISDRGFAWARIDLPGTNDLYVVSVHLKASSGVDNESRRAAEAAELKDLITTNFPAGAWIIVAGDMNLYAESEAAILTFKTFLSDSPVPADQNGDADTNAGRSERYDRVLPSFSLTNTLVPVAMPSRTFPSGLVFDSRVYTPLTDVPPVLSTDSGASGMQHMGVVKDFSISFTVTNGNVAPVITNQPQSLTVTQNQNAAFTVLAGGTAPLNYQWRFGSTNLAGATLSTYTRTNAQTNDAGDYSVVVSNAAGSVTSIVAVLTVLVPPGIVVPPQPQVVNQGAAATFSVTASGSLPFRYQWRFGPAHLPGGTASSFIRSNVQPSDVGDYSVIITNAAGGITSAPAALLLVIPSPYLTMPAPGLLAWQGLSNLNYTVQGSTNIGLTNWESLGTASSPSNMIWFSFPPTNNPAQWFRVRHP